MNFILDYFNFRIVAQYAAEFERGLGNTIAAALVSLVLSLALGALMALALLSHRGWLRRPAQAYVAFVRATPLLVQIYLIYFGLPALIPATKSVSELTLGIIALIANSTPYMAEIVRAGIASVPRGQIEGAKALGMTFVERMRYVVLPQAFANVVPPLLGQTAVLVKDTSLLSIITVFELTSAGLLLNSERVRPNEAFLTIAAGYLAIYVVLALLAEKARRALAGRGWNAAR